MLQSRILKVRIFFVGWIATNFVSSCVTPESTTQNTISQCAKITEIDPPYEPDPTKLSPEVLLQAYLRVNTSSSSGCEGKAARFWKRFFDRYGIESEVVPLPFGEDRANVIARVNNNAPNGKHQRPLILLNYLDVAPASDGKWTGTPASPEIKDVWISGPGVFSMKATTVTYALAMVKAARLSWQLNRDLIFLGTANGAGSSNPEKGVISGAEWMLTNRLKDLRRAQYVITAGGGIPSPGGSQLRWEVSTAEKSRLEMTFKASEHLADSATVNSVLTRAAAKIMTGFYRPLEVEPDQEQGREAGNELGKPLDKDVIGEVESNDVDSAVSQNRRVAVLTDPAVRANYETTLALTMLGAVGRRDKLPPEARAEMIFIGGAARRTAVEAAVIRTLLPGVGIAEIRQVDGNLRVALRASSVTVGAATPPLNGGANALLVKTLVKILDRVATKEVPAKSVVIENLHSVDSNSSVKGPEFVIDFRLLPGESESTIIREIKSLIAGLDVEMTLTERPLLAVESRTDTPLFDAIAAAHDKLTHQMRTRPPLETPILTTTTDASFFRRKGMVVYGFEPIPRDLDAERTQAKEDSIALSSLKFAIDVTETYLQDFLSRTALRPSAALK